MNERRKKEKKTMKKEKQKSGKREERWRNEVEEKEGIKRLLNTKEKRKGKRIM